MSETDDYILNSIRTWVWSGFFTPDEVQEFIGDILEDDADESMLRAAVDPEFQKKAQDEKSWPAITDCDRLDAAFDEMEASGLIALQNAGYTMSDGHADVGDAYEARDQSRIKGYCFYHGQDLERAVAGDGLMLAFGDLEEGKSQKAEIGQLVKSVFEKHGLAVSWDGDPEKRINLPKIDWKRRYKA